MVLQGASSSNWTQLLMAEAKSGVGCTGLPGGVVDSEMRPIFSEESSCSEWERSWQPPSTAGFSPEELSDGSEEDESPGKCSSAAPSEGVGNSGSSLKETHSDWWVAMTWSKVVMLRGCCSSSRC